jgi:hypothetical protein
MFKVGDIVVDIIGLNGITQGNTYVVVKHLGELSMYFEEMILSMHVSVINDMGKSSMYFKSNFTLLSEVRDYRLGKILGGKDEI